MPQLRADVSLPWRIGAGTPAGKGRAGRRERQCAAKIVGELHVPASELASIPSDAAQGEQQCRLKTVAGADRRVDDIDRQGYLMTSIMPALPCQA